MTRPKLNHVGLGASLPESSLPFRAPMNLFLSKPADTATGAVFTPAAQLISSLKGLISLHDDMVVQLRTDVACTDRSEVVGASALLQGMISQHQRAATELRRRLQPSESSPV